MIDYDSPDFKEILISRGTGKGNIAPIMNLEAAYRVAANMEINAPDMSRICGIALNGESEDNPIDVGIIKLFGWEQRRTSKDTILQHRILYSRHWLIFLRTSITTIILIR